MKVKLQIENDRIVGYITYPITDDMIEVDSLPDDLLDGAYNLVNGVITYVGYTEEKQAMLKENALNELRVMRSGYLHAFDKYRSAVSYGIVSETEEEHNDILAWYQTLLDITESGATTLSAVSTPEKIKYYM